MEIKAVAVDVDGTLTNERGLLDCRALKAIRMLEDANISIILATGYLFYTVSTLKIYLGTSGPVIAENGGVVGYPWTKFEILGERKIAEEADKILRERLGERYIPHDSNRFRFVDLAFQRTIPAVEVQRILDENGIEAHVMDSGYALHILDRRVDKGVALRRAASMMGLLPINVASIGDGLNDIQMFKVSGYSIALANAPSTLKSEANYICVRGFAEGFEEAAKHLLEMIK